MYSPSIYDSVSVSVSLLPELEVQSTTTRYPNPMPSAVQS